MVRTGISALVVLVLAIVLTRASAAPAPADSIVGEISKCYDDRICIVDGDATYWLVFATPDAEDAAIALSDKRFIKVTGHVIGRAGKKRVFLVKSFTVGFHD